MEGDCFVIGAAAKALQDLFSRPFRAILWKSLGLTLMLFAALFAGVQVALSFLELERLPWLEPVIAVIAGLGIIAAFVFLAAPVTAVFAGLFLERIATLVENTHYPEDPPGRPLTAVASLATAIQFAIVVLAVNLIALPFLLIGVGAMVMLVANAYLLSREFFDMASLRHLPRDTAVRLRQKHAREIFMAGLLPAAVALLPLANLVVPVFSTAYFTHLVKSFLRSEERVSSAQTGRGRG